MAPPKANPSEYPKPTKLTSVEQVGGIFCHICHFKFANKVSYDSHYKKHNTGNSKIIYTCVICYKEITNYPSFRGHCYTRHLIKTKFRCEHCQKQFSKLVALQSHIDLMHKFKCTKCKKEFPSNTEMQLHQIVHTEDKPPFSCKICEKKINSLITCEEHVELHSKFKYPCPICNNVNENKMDVTEHLKLHFGDVPDENTNSYTEEIEVPDDSAVDLLGIVCVLCDIQNTLKNRTEFNLHFSEMHSDDDIVFTCSICQQQFDNYKTFSRHCYSHLMKNRLRCHICSKSFERLSLLVVHNEAYHVNNIDTLKPFSCDECDQSFCTNTGLLRHMRQQHGIQYFKCREPNCGLKFETIKSMMLHQKTHLTISDNWCRLCGLAFTSLEICKNHLSFHKTKLYTCPVCKKTCTEKYDIMQHIPQHFETVLHVCKVCGKIFNAKYRFMEHCKTHSNSKSLTCSYCAKSFATSQTLKLHLSIHTGLKSYNCTICMKTFNFHPNWAKHMKRIHKVDSKAIKNLAKEAQKNNVEVTSKSTEVIEIKPDGNNLPNLDKKKPSSIEILDVKYIVKNDANIINNKNTEELFSNDSSVKDEKIFESNVKVKTGNNAVKTENGEIGLNNTICNAFKHNVTDENHKLDNNFAFDTVDTSEKKYQSKIFTENELIGQDNIEEGINSLCSELMSKQNSIFADSTQNEVELDSINPTITKEIHIFHENENCYMEIGKMNPVNAVQFEIVADNSPNEATVKSADTNPEEYLTYTERNVSEYISSVAFEQMCNDNLFDYNNASQPPVSIHDLTLQRSEDYLGKTSIDNIPNLQYKRFDHDDVGATLFSTYQDDFSCALDVGDAGVTRLSFMNADIPIFNNFT